MAETSQNFDATNPGNWIALSRNVREHPIVGAGQPVDPADTRRGAWSRMEAWFDLLCLAQWKPSRINNKGQVMTLDAGQLMGALPFLAARWNWTIGTVRWYLSTLERAEMISRALTKTDNHDGGNSRQPTNKCNVITIANYSKYQIISNAPDGYVHHTKRQANNRHATGEQQANASNLTRKTDQQGNKKEKHVGYWKDSAAGQPAPPISWWQNPEKVAEMTLDGWRSFIAQHANGVWPVSVLGPAPGDHRCVVPPSIIAELGLTERFTPGGISREAPTFNSRAESVNG